MKSKFIKKFVYSVILTLLLFTTYININKSFYIERKTISLNVGSKDLIMSQIKDIKFKK